MKQVFLITLMFFAYGKYACAQFADTTTQLVKVGINPRLTYSEFAPPDGSMPPSYLPDLAPSTVFYDTVLTKKVPGYFFLGRYGALTGNRVEVYSIQDQFLRGIVPRPDAWQMWGVQYSPIVNEIVWMDGSDVTGLDTNFRSTNHVWVTPHDAHGFAFFPDSSVAYKKISMSYDTLPTGESFNWTEIWRKWPDGRDSLIFTTQGLTHPNTTDWFTCWKSRMPAIWGLDFEHWNSVTVYMLPDGRYFVIANFRHFGIVIRMPNGDLKTLAGSQSALNDFAWVGNTVAEFLDGHHAEMQWYDPIENKAIITLYKNGNCEPDSSTSFDFYEIDFDDMAVRIAKRVDFVTSISAAAMSNFQLTNLPPLGQRTREDVLTADIAFNNMGGWFAYALDSASGQVSWFPQWGIIVDDTLAVAGYLGPDIDMDETEYASHSYQGFYYHPEEVPFMEKFKTRLQCYELSDGSYAVALPETGLDTTSPYTSLINGEKWVRVNETNETWLGWGVSPYSQDEALWFTKPLNMTLSNLREECSVATAIQELNFLSTALVKAYPNPVGVQANLGFTSLVGRVEMYSLAGQLVAECNQCQDLAAPTVEGLYFLHLQEGELITVIKIVVQ